MRVGTLIGIVLIIIGAIGVIYGGITYTRERETVSVGPLEMTATKKETIPVPPIIGGVLILAGLGIVVATRRAS